MKVRQKAVKFVCPVLEARHAAFKDAESNGQLGALEKQDDFIQWLIDKHRARGNKVTLDQLVQNIFITIVTSMHSTSSITYSVLLNLLAHLNACTDIKDKIAHIRRDKLHGGQF